MTNFYENYSICGRTLGADGLPFRAIFLHFVYILKFVSFLLENKYGRLDF